MSIDSNKTAGDAIESRCLKCKALTNHIIIAITGDNSAKVQCNSCGSRHNYRPPVAEKKKSATTLRRRDGAVTESDQAAGKPTKTRTPRKKVAGGVVNFEALVKNKDINAAIPYTMEVTLAVGDQINHSTFGWGVVTATIAPNKAQVTFQEQGTKVLICKL